MQDPYLQANVFLEEGVHRALSCRNLWDKERALYDTSRFEEVGGQSSNNQWRGSAGLVHKNCTVSTTNGSPIMRWRILPRFVTSSIPSARFEQNQPKKCCILRNPWKFTKIIENCTSYQQSRLQNTHSIPAFI